ncbi:hypothetical protein PS15m_003189 [Mucor circinelloides]
MDDEFDEFLLDDYNIDTVENNQRSTSAVDDTNDDTQETTTSKKTFKKKFNADLLLEPKGIPLLKNESQYLKFKKTKGHEHEDLKKLMAYYTVWANNLYPGLRFQDFARRVVNPAKSKLVRSMIDNWSDEYRQRRQIRLDMRNELSGKTVGDEDVSDAGQPVAEDDESSEDDNRPLFFPVTNTNKANTVASTQNKKKAKPKAKSKSKPVIQPRTKTVIDTDDEDDDEKPLFTPSQQQNNKGKVVLDDSSDEEDTYNMSRSSALQLIIERKRKREQAQREEQERLSRPKPSTSRSIIEDYDQEEEEEEPALFENQEENVELALSDSELASLGIPTRKQKNSMSAMDQDPVEDVQLVLSDSELLELGLPVNKPADTKTTAVGDDVQLAMSDNELESLGLATTKTTTTNSVQQQQQQQQQQQEEEQFSDNELFDIQEA